MIGCELKRLSFPAEPFLFSGMERYVGNKSQAAAKFEFCPISRRGLAYVFQIWQGGDLHFTNDFKPPNVKNVGPPAKFANHSESRRRRVFSRVVDFSGSNDFSLRLWEFSRSYEFPEPNDWNDGAEVYLEHFLTLCSSRMPL